MGARVWLAVPSLVLFAAAAALVAASASAQFEPLQVDPLSGEVPGGIGPVRAPPEGHPALPGPQETSLFDRLGGPPQVDPLPPQDCLMRDLLTSDRAGACLGDVEPLRAEPPYFDGPQPPQGPEATAPNETVESTAGPDPEAGLVGELVSEPSGVWVNEALEPEAPPEASTPLPDESLPEAYGAGAPTAPATAFSGPPAPSFRLPGILLVAGGFLLWRAVAFAAPLFSRLKGQQAREQEVRAAMLRLVRRNPGIHAAEMSRCLGLNESHTRYHLGVLERFNLVRKERVHKYACYFPVSGAAAHPDGRMVAILKAGRARRVLAFAAANPGGAVSTLERQEGLPRGAFDYHLRRLAAANLLEVRRDGARRRLFLNATMGTAGPRSGQILATSRVPSEGSPGNPLKIQENPA